MPPPPSSHFERALIIGASSGIGAELARQMAARGTQVALVARRESELAALQSEIIAASGDAARARTYVHDVTCYAEVPALFQAICRDLGGLDVIVYSSGVMPLVADNEYNFDKDFATISVNVLGAIAWLNEAGQRFGQLGAGTIVGISSVAGDRGRRGQMVYGTSKAALDTYLEGLRNRVGRMGVRVITIKPGPIETPMTAQMGKLPFMIGAAQAAREIITALERNKRVAYVPAKWGLIMGVIKRIPSPVFQKMNF